MPSALRSLPTQGYLGTHLIFQSLAQNLLTKHLLCASTHTGTAPVHLLCTCWAWGGAHETLAPDSMVLVGHRWSQEMGSSSGGLELLPRWDLWAEE